MFKNIDLLEIAKIIVPSAAIIISIISLVKSNRNTKRQVRIGKLEEIIEYLQVFIVNYDFLYRIHQSQLLFKNAPKNASVESLEHSLNIYKEYVKIFKSEVDMDKLQDKNIRLRVLSNSYLPDKELKRKILSTVALMTNLVNCTIFENFEQAKRTFTKYPSPIDFVNYVDNIEKEILTEMNLGYKGTNIDQLEKYKRKFMSDLKI